MFQVCASRKIYGSFISRAFRKKSQYPWHWYDRTVQVFFFVFSIISVCPHCVCGILNCIVWWVRTMCAYRTIQSFTISYKSSNMHISKLLPLKKVCPLHAHHIIIIATGWCFSYIMTHNYASDDDDVCMCGCLRVREHFRKLQSSQTTISRSCHTFGSLSYDHHIIFSLFCFLIQHFHLFSFCLLWYYELCADPLTRLIALIDIRTHACVCARHHSKNNIMHKYIN